MVKEWFSLSLSLSLSLFIYLSIYLSFIHTHTLAYIDTHGTSIWDKVMQKKTTQRKCKGIERIVDSTIENVFHAVSHKSLCIVTGFTSITTEIKETIELCKMKDIGIFENKLNHSTKTTKNGRIQHKCHQHDQKT